MYSIICKDNEIKEEIFNQIYLCSNLLKAGQILKVYHFGKNRKYELSIQKDYDFDREKSETEWNLVRITTYNTLVIIDETLDIHVDDLDIELDRIWNEKDFSLID